MFSSPFAPFYSFYSFETVLDALVSRLAIRHFVKRDLAKEHDDASGTINSESSLESDASLENDEGEAKESAH